MKNIVIFIDSYNDTDHILPFIDYVLLNQKANVVLYTTKNNSLNSCKDHLQYLKKVHNLVPVNYDQGFGKKYSILINAYWKFRFLSYKGKRKSYLLPLLFLFYWLQPIFVYFTQREINRIQKHINADVIMMDFGKEISLYGHAIVKYSQNNSIPVIGYLHGFSIYTNTDSLQKDKKKLNPVKKTLSKLTRSKIKRVYFDRYVVGKKQRETHFRSSMMGNYDEKCLDRVHEIGLPRFASEWIYKYEKYVISSKRFAYGDSNKINVVLFMNSPKYNVLADHLISTIKALSSCSNINFVFKPHTRDGLSRINSKEINGYNASEISSLELSSWADVGIVYGSSIAFQLLQDDVVLIVPKYIHLNTTVFEESSVCVLSNSLDDLINILSHSKEDVYSMINKKNVSNFIKYYVYGGNSSYDKLMDKFYNSVTGI